MRFLIIFILLISNVFAATEPNIKNIVVNKEPKTYDSVIFLDVKGQKISLNEFKNNLVILNFWATWCAPCKEEMPSLDKLQVNQKFNNLKIFPINIGQDSVKKSEEFFSDLKIENMKIYFDPEITLAKTFLLRGVPTSIIFNKKGEEFARIIGSIDFGDKKFLDWLSNYN
ncbi:MAG: TlpA disulfide reductase family protein [Pelagibacteraceae bacterium]|jgi:thiol-disulfide isomerase/thioredoxin